MAIGIAKPIPLKPSGLMDFRSDAPDIAVGDARLLINVAVNEQGKPYRPGGWRRNMGASEFGYNNQDLRDQLLDLQFYKASADCPAPAHDYEDFDQWELSDFAEGDGADLIGSVECGRTLDDVLPGNGLYLRVRNVGANTDIYLTTSVPIALVAGETYRLQVMAAGSQVTNGDDVLLSVDVDEMPGDMQVPRAWDDEPSITQQIFTAAFNVAAAEIEMQFRQGAYYSIPAAYSPIVLWVKLDHIDPDTEAVIETLFYEDWELACKPTLGTRGGCREAVLHLTEMSSDAGARKLIAMTQKRWYELDERGGNWRILADNLGSPGRNVSEDTCRPCSGPRWQTAQLLGYLVGTNGLNPVMAYKQGDANTGCNLWAAQPIQELLDVGITRAGVVVEFKGFILIADVDQDGVRRPGRIFWSDFNEPLSWLPLPGTSLSGFLDVGFSEKVLRMEPMGDYLMVYTDAGVKRVEYSLVIDPVTGIAQQVFKATDINPNSKKNASHPLRYQYSLVNTGTEHLFATSDGIYVLDSPFSPAPRRVEWLHKATGIIYTGATRFSSELQRLPGDLSAVVQFGPINKRACDAFIGGYNALTKEVWWTWASDTEECANVSMRVNLQYAAACVVDHGFTAFALYRSDTRPTFNQWLESLSVCTAANTTFDLTKMVRDLFNEDVDGPSSNLSGITYSAETETLFAIQNNPTNIYEYDTDGVLLRTIALANFVDTEGIAWLHGNTFAISEENPNNRITIINIDPGQTTLDRNDGTTHNTGFAYGNLGVEGVTYSLAADLLYFITEKSSTGTSTTGVWNVWSMEPGSGTVTAVFDLIAPIGTTGIATDLADIYFDPVSGHIFLLSQESEVVIEISLSGNVLATFDVSEFNQAEGMTFLPDKSRMFIVGEPNTFGRYVLPLKQGEMQGQTTAFDDPVPYIWNAEEEPDGVIAEDALCAIIADVTINELCEGCDSDPIFIAASSQDLLLKEMTEDVFYRERWLGGELAPDGSRYAKMGYPSLIQSGGMNFNTHVEKAFHNLTVEFKALSQTTPNLLYAMIGFGPQANCPMWAEIGVRELRCLTAKSLEQHEEQNTRPDLLAKFPHYFRGVFAHYRLYVLGAGGGTSFDRIDLSVRNAQT